jgi:hypothetical protein
MYIDSKIWDMQENYPVKSRAQQMRERMRLWMSTHGFVSRKRVRFGPNSVLVLCGTRGVHPLSVEVVEQLFGRRRMQYILAGLEGRDCSADLLKQRWWVRCFGENAQFPIIVTEHCPCWIEKKILIDAYSASQKHVIIYVFVQHILI